MEVRTADALMQRPDPTPSSGRVGTAQHWAMQEADDILSRVVIDALTPETRCYLQHAIAMTLIRLLGQMDAPPGQQNVFLAEMGSLAYRQRFERALPPLNVPASFDELPPLDRQAFINFAAAVRRRVVNWKLTAEEVTV
jgi:hypothetical protein